MKPGDYIIKPDGYSEATIWRVTGVYYGGLGHQDVVGLVPINRKCAAAHERDLEEIFAPIELVEEYLFERRFESIFAKKSA